MTDSINGRIFEKCAKSPVLDYSLNRDSQSLGWPRVSEFRLEPVTTLPAELRIQSLRWSLSFSEAIIVGGALWCDLDKTPKNFYECTIQWNCLNVPKSTSNFAAILIPNFLLKNLISIDIISIDIISFCIQKLWLKCCSPPWMKATKF